MIHIKEGQHIFPPSTIRGMGKELPWLLQVHKGKEGNIKEEKGVAEISGTKKKNHFLSKE